MENKENKKMDILLELENRIRELIEKEENLTLSPIADAKYKYMYDPDSSLRAWEYYFVTYKDILFCMDEVKDQLYVEDFSAQIYIEGKRYKRIIGVFDYTKSIWMITDNKLIVGQNIGIAGDCVFNFNEKKVPIFWKNIDKDNTCEMEVKKKIREILLLCLSMHYSVYNFSLMPKNGGMQIVKGRDSFDRLGTLLNLLDDYLSKNNSVDNHEVLSGICKKYVNSKNALKKFLHKIDSLENYCKTFYHIDNNTKYVDVKGNEKTLINAILDSGKFEMKSCEEIIEYISIAVRFWEHQKDIYEQRRRE